MHDSRDAFLNEIIAHPSEDAPRLVFADWLEEHGDPRGEFIRVQCQLAGIEPDDPLLDKLSDRESSLLTQFGDQWREDLPEWARPGCEFRRGFVERVAVWRHENFSKLHQLRHCTPLQTLSLHDVAGTMKEFVASGVLEWIRGVEVLDSAAGFHEMRDLLSLPDDDQDGAPKPVFIQRLSMLGLTLSDAAAIVLKYRVNLPNLESLELVRCDFGSHGAQFLAETERLPRLISLDLSENEIGDAGVWHLASAAARSTLRQLHLRETSLTDEAIQHLAGAVFTDNLRTLDVSGNRLTDASAAILAKRMPNLKWLTARNCYFTPRGLLQLQERFSKRMRV